MSWRCPSCHGAAICLAVLKRLTTHERIVRLWNSAWHTEATGAPCPSCDNPTRSLVLEGLLPLDACRTCEMVWFDGGELARFAPKRQESSSAPPDVKRTAERAVALASSMGHHAEAARIQAAHVARAHDEQKRRTAALDALVAALLG